MERVTSRVLTPCRRTRPGDRAASGEVAGGTVPTRILDWHSSEVLALVAGIGGGRLTPREYLQRAHAVIGSRIVARYALDDCQPASRTLRRGRGSCSQRLAVLESVARARGIRTRVRGLLVDGSFWYPRFPRLRRVVPDVVVLAWPEFRLEDGWVSASELFGPTGDDATGFTNDGGETLFDAIARTTIDWDGTTSTTSSCSVCDLSGSVSTDLGRFDSRDALFAAHGQTLSAPARLLADPLMSRRAAGARSDRRR